MKYITTEDLNLINELENKIKINPDYLDFSKENTKYYTHGYHTYPAMMIPQLANEFIELSLKYRKDIKNLYDPFMGSGTSLVEGIVHKLDVYGIDINPLSQLMAKAKTTAINPSILNERILELNNAITQFEILYKNNSYHISNTPNFDRIDFWFKPEVIKYLQLIKNCILEFEGEIKTFFLATFSETVRYVSNTRNNEFKLYRMAPDKLENWNPNVIETFYKFLYKNQQGNNELYKQLNLTNNLNPKVIIGKGSNIYLPNDFKNQEFDLVVTSPPYGDSKTTVAYGQFSRLSLQWLDLHIDKETKINQLDNIMLGGKVNRDANIKEVLYKLNSPTLNKVYELIKERDEKRANEVLQFYFDLDKSIKSTSSVMKINSYQFWVVANRTVKKVNIPTDVIIAELFGKYNVKHLHSFYRRIPNKRMPSKNSPTNKIGNHSVTMTSEIILMFKKTN